VILDGRLFRETFAGSPKRNLNDIFSYYRKQKLAAKAAGDSFDLSSPAEDIIFTIPPLPLE